MTNLTGRRESVALIAQDEAFGSLTQKMALTERDLQCLFKTVAAACETNEERWLYLQKAKAMGLNPLKGELMVSKRGGSLTFQTSYYVFVSRARRADWSFNSGVVWSTDEWGGWDEGVKQPLKHVSKSLDPTNRGRILGVWATADRLQDGQKLHEGVLFALSDVAMSPQWKSADDRWTKEAREDVWVAIQIGAYGPFWQRSPGRQAEKCAIAHLCRRLVPDLEALYLSDEVGGGFDSDKPIDIAPLRTVTPATDGAPVVDSEVVTPTPTDPAAPVDDPRPADAGPPPEIDQRVLAAMGRLGQKHRRIGGALEKHFVGTKPAGSKLTADEKETLIACADAAFLIAEADQNEALRLIAEQSLVPLVERLRHSAEELTRGSNG